ncbi:MAG TPA: TIGR02757 family protein [Bacteroidia bacterium]|nr:TIGR02757 family protein [Bacteroidia bacterium]
MRGSKATERSRDDIRDFLERKTREFNRPEFIASDPISIPHLFTSKEDREIAGFLVATIAWGQRPTIVRNGMRWMELMSHAPHEFVMNAGKKDLQLLSSFVHRTFNGGDAVTFMHALKNIYAKHGGLESVFIKTLKEQGNMLDAISQFRKVFFSVKHETRTEKHVSDPSKGSSAKRINMFLRWMVRKDSNGVDFGIWKSIPPAVLMIPLDVHVGNVARSLEILHAKQDNRKAVEELTAVLREFDPIDPVKYDFALFGVGITEKK